MASLRRTRRFSSSPAPSVRQQSPDHDRDSNYCDSLVPEVSTSSSAFHGRGDGRSKNVRKMKSQLAFQYSHIDDDDGRENGEYRASSSLHRNVAREISPASLESRGRKKRHDKGTRSQSARPRPNDVMEDHAFHSPKASASGGDVERIPPTSTQASLFLVPKSKSRSQSRSPSPMPAHHPPHTRVESSLSASSQSFHAVSAKPSLRANITRRETSRSESRSSSEDAVTRKSYHYSALPVPSSRAPSPFHPQTLASNVPDSDSSSRGEHLSRSLPPVLKSCSKAQQKLSSLPLNSRREKSKKQSDDSPASLPVRSRSHSRASHASPTPLASQQSAVPEPRTLKDVTRSLEVKLRGKLSNQHTPRRFEYAVYDLHERSSQQTSPGSTPMQSRNETSHEDFVSKPSPNVDVKRNVPVDRSRLPRPGQGLALMTEQGHALGEPSFEEAARTRQLRFVRRETASEFSSSPVSSSNVLAKEPAILSGSDPLKWPNGRCNRAPTHDASSFSNIMQRERDKPFSQMSAVPSRSESESTEDDCLSRDYIRTPRLISHGTAAKELPDLQQGSNNNDAFGARRLETPPGSTRPEFTPSLPKPFPKPILVSRQPSNPVHVDFPSLLTPRASHIENSFSHAPCGSDTSSSSIPRPRKLVIRNLSQNDQVSSSSSSSNPGTPKSEPAATSGDYTILALSASQTTLAQANLESYVVPEVNTVAAEVLNDEERRRKALAGLVHDLHLENDEQDKEQRTRTPPKLYPHVLQDVGCSRQEPHLNDADYDEEDDDEFFARLSMNHDEGPLLEEPKPETNVGLSDDDEHSYSDCETETEEGGDEGEDPPLPPTPKFVHSLVEGDDLESRIQRVTSLNRISPTLSRSRDLGDSQQVRPRAQSPGLWKPPLTPARENASSHVRPTDLRGGSEQAERSSQSRINSQESYESTKRRGAVVVPSFVHSAQNVVSSSESHGTIQISDNEPSLALLDAGSGTEALSCGAEALFRQLQVEADAEDEKQQLTNAGRGRNNALDHIDTSGDGSRTPHEADSISARTVYRLEHQDVPFVKPQDSTSLRTWRSTLPIGAYDSLAERHGPSEMRRQEVIWELCETEQAFVKSLRLILRLFVQPLRHEDKTWIPGVPRDVTRLFDWFDDIMHLHSEMSSALHAARSAQYPVVIQIAEILRPFVPRLELHQPYLVRLESVSSAVEAMSKDMQNDFGEFIRIQTASPECGSMNLASFLLKPVQRLMKYPLFFKQLWELTPRSHPDHLATFSLLHSTDMIIRVMQEVKAREEEYELVKNLASRIKGLPSGYQLARRERRLVAQGLLRRVLLSDKERSALETAAEARESQNSQNMSASTLTSTSSENSSFSGDWPYHPKRPGGMATSGTDHSLQAESTVSDTSFDSITNVSRSSSRSTSRSRSSSLRGSLRHKSKESSVYAFVFTDLMILATPMTERGHLLRSPKNANDSGKENWKLIEDVGVSRVLGVTDQSGQLPNHEHLITVELMSMTPHILEIDAFSDGATAIPVYLSIPNQRAPSGESSYEVFAGAKARWLEAFERCFRFTLRSLSFPSYVRKCSTSGGNTDLELDTKSSVMSILSSGLPLPMSPSQQLDEAQRGRQADLIQEEREERGWWSLRFHQVLKEIQRSSGSPVLDAAPSRRSDARSKLQGGKRSEPRPLILSPNPITVSSRKVGLLSLGRKKLK